MRELHLKDLKPDPRNARKHNPRNVGMIVDALHEVGAARSGVVDEDNNILAGNGTYDALAQAGIERVKVVEADGNEWVVVQRKGLTPEQKRKLAIYDNRTGELAEWDTEVLLDDVEHGLDLTRLFTEEEWEVLMSEGGQGGGEILNVDLGDARRSLLDRFIVPPLSVLDARQGYWQDRKRAWIALGIQSELGRGENLQGISASDGEYFHDRKAYVSRQACPGGSPRPAASLGPDGRTRRGDGKGRTLGAIPSGDGESTGAGTSIFDPVLCELTYRWFCPPGGRVLDPFAGGSVRGIVSAHLGRRYTGIDLSGRQLEANRTQAQKILGASEPTTDDIAPILREAPTWIEGDSQDVGELAPGEYDFVFTCPPYADLEVYSDDPRDLSTMDYSTFLEKYRDIIARSCAMLRGDRFACIVVGDVRDKQGRYRNFVSDTIEAFQDAGLAL